MPFLVATLSAVQAQGVERSFGSHEVAPVALAPTRLIANLTPADAGSEVKGGISFGLAGDVLVVSGRLDGLDPNKRYRLCVALSENVIPEAKIARPNDGGAGNPVAQLTADADGNLGVLLADASGGVEIKTALKGVGLAEGDRVVLGKTLILSEIPAEGVAGAPVRVASAMVKIPELGLNPVQPSRLDELEPGERWF